MKLQNYPLFFLLTVLNFYTYAQENEQTNIKEKSEFWNKVRFGGGLGLDFSNNRTSLNIAPTAIYQLNNRFYSGAGIHFGYSSFKENNAKQFNYGLSLINLYNPIDKLQLSGELEYTFVNESFRVSGEKFTRDFNFPSIFIGAGYNFGNFSAGLRYDLLFNEDKSIYNSALMPFARVFF